MSRPPRIGAHLRWAKDELTRLNHELALAVAAGEHLQPGELRRLLEGYQRLRFTLDGPVAGVGKGKRPVISNGRQAS